MIQILPVREGELPDFCRERGLPETEGLRACAARQGEILLGWCAVEAGEPCSVLGMEAEDAALADGLLRAALFPLYQEGTAGYRFLKAPSCPLPGGYVTSGEGSLTELFAPCDQREGSDHE